ncbi:hypothetical protein BaRGS_00016332 [Batillaria attramentaria]|uniref:Uncharacterized protein n=1 Tax=Batillaria attramentaria TaxID=370345 RepID=A0ABD0L084_9CAEN
MKAVRLAVSRYSGSHLSLNSVWFSSAVTLGQPIVYKVDLRKGGRTGFSRLSVKQARGSATVPAHYELAYANAGQRRSHQTRCVSLQTMY